MSSELHRSARQNPNWRALCRISVHRTYHLEVVANTSLYDILVHCGDMLSGDAGPRSLFSLICRPKAISSDGNACRALSYFCHAASDCTMASMGRS